VRMVRARAPLSRRIETRRVLHRRAAQWADGSFPERRKIFSEERESQSEGTVLPGPAFPSATMALAMGVALRSREFLRSFKIALRKLVMFPTSSWL
jgi:hypothetical protein